MHQFHIDGSQAADHEIFVFGSNLSGIHGGGAAKAAHKFYGAEWGVGEGLTGRSYALPTVQKEIRGKLPLEDIKAAVNRFVEFTKANPDMQFFVTRVGCVLAGYSDDVIAPMFKDAINCNFAEDWAEYL